MLFLDLVFGQFLVDQSLDFLENFDIVLGYQGNSFTCLTSTSCSTNSMDIVFGVAWDIKVDDDIDRWDIKSTRSHISRNQDVSLTGFEPVETI